MTEKMRKNGKGCKGFDISSAGLHIIAMASMLIDHALRTVIENDSAISLLGRLAFPIFAFMAAEGYFYTRNFRRYILRMLIFALISEIPYDLMKTGEPFDRYDQNVIWTFLIALLCLRAVDALKEKTKGRAWLNAICMIGISFAGAFLGMLFSVDYGGMGVLTVLIFHFFRERRPRNMAVQFILLLIINAVFLGGFGYGIMVSAFGVNAELPVQGFAIFALIPIWLYRGRQGHHSKPFRYFCYAFYPAHMAILYAASLLLK